MGLSMVYGLIKQHGGWLTATSQKDQGTTFEIFLPVSDKPLSQDEDVAEIIPSIIHSGEHKVLIVEDNKGGCLFSRITLESMGFQVYVAPNADMAIQIWHEQNQEIDLLFTDIILPKGKTGVDLARHLKAQKPQLGILFTSGYNMAEIKMDEVPHQILSKPYTVDQLFETVQHCLSTMDNGKDRRT